MCLDIGSLGSLEWRLRHLSRALGLEKVETLLKDARDGHFRVVEVCVLGQTVFQKRDLLSQCVNILPQRLHLNPVLVHEAIRVDRWQNGMFVLLLHHMSFNEFGTLHLEGENLGHFRDPCRLVGLVPLTILLVLIVGHL